MLVCPKSCCDIQDDLRHTRALGGAFADETSEFDATLKVETPRGGPLGPARHSPETKLFVGYPEPLQNQCFRVHQWVLVCPKSCCDIQDDLRHTGALGGAFADETSELEATPSWLYSKESSWRTSIVKDPFGGPQ